MAGHHQGVREVPEEDAVPWSKDGNGCLGGEGGEVSTEEAGRPWKIDTAWARSLFG